MVFALDLGMAATRLRSPRPSQVPVTRLHIPAINLGGRFGPSESFRLALAASVWQPQERLMLTLNDDDAGAWKRLFKVASAVLATSLVLALVF